ncbi:glutaredoxin domain-containing protein [Rothia kristinae]|uniref:glutaredoxin domain-containing protein n=1 Tax=Actinomycetes TaxID=1760 RepID=UPI003437AE9A
MTITVYTKTDCQQCTATKRWLDNRGHTYQTINLEESPDDLAAIQELGHLQAPVVIVSKGGGPDVHWSGFNPTQLSAYLGEVAA